MKTKYIVESDGKRRLAVRTKCVTCGAPFWAKQRFRVRGKAKYCGRKCARAAQRRRVKLECSRCGVSFERPPSKVTGRHGLVFCSRRCKDLTQRLSSGPSLIQPTHYTDGQYVDYRKLAFDRYAHCCANPMCGWDEDPRILEVHHFDGDRMNNEPENLVILCPICHRKVTSGFYRLSAQYNLEEVLVGQTNED